MPALTKHLPLQAYEDSLLSALGNGLTVADAHHDLTTDEAEAVMAEIALRVNLHDELVEELRSIATGICRFDVLNPCWADRPGDVAGKHWGGGPACPECRASAILANVDQTEGR